jgi:myb proto-oncogene protein
MLTSTQIASVMPGRTGQQCLHRWTKNLNPNIRKGKWLPEEDKVRTQPRSL